MNSECCPCRASLQSGGYQSQSTGVQRNSHINGTRLRLDKKNSIGTLLDQGGYQTTFIGKYMHGYHPGYTFQGYDFIAANSYENAWDWEDLDKVTFITRQSDGSLSISISDIAQYVTDFHRDQALEFLRTVDEGPFLLNIGSDSMHRIPLAYRLRKTLHRLPLMSRLSVPALTNLTFQTCRYRCANRQLC